MEKDQVKYVPAPYESTNDPIPGRLFPLLMKMAENNHDQFNQDLIEEGFTYGNRYSDEEKTSNTLVPFEQVQAPNYQKSVMSDMEYYIKLIRSLGYDIVQTNFTDEFKWGAFISYSRKDIEKAKEIKALVEELSGNMMHQ